MNLLNDIVKFLEENGAASPDDLMDALECDREELREAVRADGKERLRYSKSASLFSLRNSD